MNEEYKIAYKLAVQLNKIPKKILARLHKKTENAVEKYLYVDDRFPDFQTLYEIYRYILSADYTMPRELQRIISRPGVRAIGIAKSEKRYNYKKHEFNNVVGEKLRSNPNKYASENGELTIDDLAEKHGICRFTVKNRLKDAGIKNGEDISNIDFSRKKRGPKLK